MEPTPDIARVPSEKIAKLADHLRSTPRGRPKTKRSLLRHINAGFGNALGAPEQEAILAELARLGVLALHDGKVSYPG